MRNYIKEVAVDGNKYIYDGYRMKLFKVDNENELKKYVLEDDCDDNCTFLGNTNEKRKVVINVSNRCNLRCRYCYADGGTYGGKDGIIDIEIVRKIIDELRNEGIIRIGILAFFGGEPLINFDVIKASILLFEKKFEIDNIEIVTNGTYLTEKMARFFMEKKVRLAISCDGPKDIMDELRGKGTYDKAMTAINMCKNMGYDNLWISATYTKKHLMAGYSYQDICDFFSKLGVRMTVSQVLTTDTSLKVPGKLTNEELEKDIVNTIENICNNKVNAQVNPFVYFFLLSLFCGARTYSFCDDLDEENSICYNYDGKRYNCFHFWNNADYIVGNTEAEKLKMENRKEMYSICSKCWSRNSCKLCLAAIKQGTLKFPFEEAFCKDQYIYERILYNLVKVIESGKHKELANNFITNFLNYK